MRIIEDKKLDFSDVLIVPKRSSLTSRQDVNLIRKFVTKHGQKFEGVPIIAANMATGNFNMLNALSEHKMFTAIAKHHNKEWKKDESLNNRLIYGFYTIGIKNQQEFVDLYDFYQWLNFNKIEFPLKILVDVANGYMQIISDYIKKLRENFPDAIIFAGNVCTPEMTEELILSGADGVKCGIGPGSFCRTRSVTGVGVPQISAIIECSDAAHGLDGLLIADGGCKEYGDVCKAFCANADLVMLGTMFAGTDECDGDIVTKYIHENEYERVDHGTYWDYRPLYVEKKYKVFYGMSSDTAQLNHFGGIKNYRASEGLIEEVQYKGPVNIQVRNILGGLRSCGTYIGAKSIKQFGKCGTFCKIN